MFFKGQSVFITSAVSSGVAPTAIYMSTEFRYGCSLLSMVQPLLKKRYAMSAFKSKIMHPPENVF
jgi:hypothetical protein